MTGKGWGRHDFYGGEDAGDDSEGASDEDRTLKEAKKLEERWGLPWSSPIPLWIDSGSRYISVIFLIWEGEA